MAAAATRFLMVHHGYGKDIARLCDRHGKFHIRRELVSARRLNLMEEVGDASFQSFRKLQGTIQTEFRHGNFPVILADD